MSLWKYEGKKSDFYQGSIIVGLESCFLSFPILFWHIVDRAQHYRPVTKADPVLKAVKMQICRLRGTSFVMHQGVLESILLSHFVPLHIILEFIMQ